MKDYNVILIISFWKYVSDFFLFLSRFRNIYRITKYQRITVNRLYFAVT